MPVIVTDQCQRSRYGHRNVYVINRGVTTVIVHDGNCDGVVEAGDQTLAAHEDCQVCCSLRMNSWRLSEQREK